MRFLGTLFGASASILVLISFDGIYPLQILFCLLLIFIAVFIATASSKFAYAGVLSAVTIAMILFGSHANLTFAFYRALEVLIGITIAVAINRYVFPIHASKRLNHNYAETLNNIQQLHHKLIKGNNYDQLLSKIFSLFSQQISLQKEVKSEKHKKHLPSYQAMTMHTRKLYRYIYVINEYINKYPKKRDRFSQHNVFLSLHHEIDLCLYSLQHSLNKSKCRDEIPIQRLEALLTDFKNTLSLQEKFRHASTLVFSIEMILSSLKEIEYAQRQIFNA